MSNVSIGRAIAVLAQEEPEATLLSHEGRSCTRLELHLRTNRLARAYAALGVGQDDLVTIALPNGIEFYEASIATWKLGATPQPISSKLPEVERRAILELAQSKLVVGADSAGVPGIATLPAGFSPDEGLPDTDLEDRTATYWKAPTSGGSTGRPKLIVSKDVGSVNLERREMKLVHLVPGPLYHNAPFSFSMRSLFVGGHVVIMSRFDAEECLRLIAHYRVQYSVMVPTMMQRIYKLGEAALARYDVSSLERILHMAAPCPAWLKQAFIDWLGPDRVWELYAGTEAQAFTMISGSEWLEHRGSVGKPMGGSQIKIMDDAGSELAPMQIGEVYMRPARGPGSTYKYVGATAKSRDGWESLGDMGYVDADGYLYLADRQSDMILSGGANLYPAEIEAAIDSFAGVRSSAVIGLPDEDMGQVAHAIVDLPNGELDEDALRSHLGERLARYKIPRSFEHVREPLRDDAGKVRRSALREARVAKTN